jgi:Icc-related predicted phosphoesterase
MHKGLENKLGLPDSDIIIHCGDITGRGTEHTTRDFLEWFNDLDQYKYKIFIAGNHDIIFEQSPSMAKEILNDYNNVIYLEDDGIELNGIKFWGTPVSKPFLNWAFNRPEKKLEQHWKAIPDDTDILITHSAPYKIMDYGPITDDRTGSPSLYREVIERIKPKVHCFGHIHNGYGIYKQNNITFINASNLDENYKIKNKPIIINI